MRTQRRTTHPTCTTPHDTQLGVDRTPASGDQATSIDARYGAAEEQHREGSRRCREHGRNGAARVYAQMALTFGDGRYSLTPRPRAGG
jgi:hypothetical protein